MTDRPAAAQTSLIRFKQACDELGMSIDAGYQHIKRGTFPVPVLKVGSIWKVRRAELDRFLNGESV